MTDQKRRFVGAKPTHGSHGTRIRRALFRRHGRIDASRSIGTELALAGLRRGVAFVTVPVPVRARRGAPRFGSTLRANWRILRALGLALRSDLRARPAPAQGRRESAK